MGNVFDLHPAEAVRHLSNYLADPGMPARVNPRLTREGEVLDDLVENLARGGDFTPARIRNLKGKLEQLGPKWEQLRLDRRYLACLVDHVASLELQGSGAPAHLQSVGQSNAPLAISPSYKPSDKAVASDGLGAAERITPKRRAVLARAGNPTFFQRHFGAAAITVAALGGLAAGVAVLYALSGRPEMQVPSASGGGGVGAVSGPVDVTDYDSLYSAAVQAGDSVEAFKVAKRSNSIILRQQFLDDLVEFRGDEFSAVRRAFYYAPGRERELEELMVRANIGNGFSESEARSKVVLPITAPGVATLQVYNPSKPWFSGQGRFVVVALPGLFEGDPYEHSLLFNAAALHARDLRDGLYVGGNLVVGSSDVASGRIGYDVADSLASLRHFYRRLVSYIGFDLYAERLPRQLPRPLVSADSIYAAAQHYSLARDNLLNMRLNGDESLALRRHLEIYDSSLSVGLVRTAAYPVYRIFIRGDSNLSMDVSPAPR